MLGIDGIQEAVQAAAKSAHVVLPPTVEALPEEVAWSMVYAEGGVLAVVLAVAVTVLWKLIRKILNETRTQNAELVIVQAAAVQRLVEAVGKIELAVQKSDSNNIHALDKITSNLGAVVVRQDKQEARMDRHSDRISVIEVEHAIEDRVRRPKTLPG